MIISNLRRVPGRVLRSTKLVHLLAAGIIYTAAALVLFAIPLHSGQCLCFGADEGASTWGFEWWPYAISHGLNPFYTHLIYLPRGIDVASGASLPAAALVMAPITLTLGPLVSYNVAIIASPVLAAFFAFLLCRRVAGGRFWPALFGGWLFGFSSYMLGQLIAHLNLTLVFLVPAIVHIAWRGYASELSRRKFTALLAAALIVQIYLSTEIFASLTLFGAVTVIAAAAMGDARQRWRLGLLCRWMLGAYVIALVLATPLIYYSLKPGGLPILPLRDDRFSTDLLSFVVPTAITKLGGSAFLGTSGSFSAGIIEGGGYLGIPLILMAGLGAWSGRQLPWVRVVALIALVTAICSLGGYLHVGGNAEIPLPWWPATHSPVLGQLIPVRFVMYTSLATALLASWWLSQTTRRAPACVVAAASVVFLWPAVGRGFWQDRPILPPLFADQRFAHVITSRDTALLVPAGPRGYSMLWQAETHLRFPIVSGYLVPPESPNPYKSDPIYPTLFYGIHIPHQEEVARWFLATSRVTVAVVDKAIPDARPWLTILQRLGWHSRTIGGAVVLRPANSSALAASRHLEKGSARVQR
jgi:hypothetical protein